MKTVDKVAGDLVEVFNSQLEKLKLVDSNRRWATRCLSKVDGIPLVTELRPITLLCEAGGPTGDDIVPHIIYLAAGDDDGEEGGGSKVPGQGSQVTVVSGDGGVGGEGGSVCG